MSASLAHDKRPSASFAFFVEAMSQQLAGPAVWLSKAASRLQRRRRRKGTVKERSRACEELIDIARAAMMSALRKVAECDALQNADATYKRKLAATTQMHGMMS